MNSSTTIAPDHAGDTEQLIQIGLALDPDARSKTLARLIAGTIHDGADTALCRFAGTGDLDPEAALGELNDVVVPLEQEGWVDALGRHILLSTERPS